MGQQPRRPTVNQQQPQQRRDRADDKSKEDFRRRIEFMHRDLAGFRRVKRLLIAEIPVLTVKGADGAHQQQSAKQPQPEA